MSGRGREDPRCLLVSGLVALLDVQEWSEALPEAGCGRKAHPMFARPSRMSGIGREALPIVRLFGRPSWMSGNGRETLPDVREW